MHSDWDENYITGETPWDSGVPEPVLVQAVADSMLPSGRVLEIGCGTGTNARYLAEQGFEVVAVDVSPTAIEQARAKNSLTGITYAVLDVLEGPLPDGPFDAVVDRGCYHVFGRIEQQETFVTKVSGALREGGCWLSLIGSTEGAPRDHGPPRRSAANVIDVVEPHLQLVMLRECAFADSKGSPMAWLCLFRKRTQPAQPATPAE